jgi:ribonuclease D
VRDRYELLHQWRKTRAKARGVESDVIIPRDALWELARRNPRTTEALETIETLGPWRRGTTGEN